MLVRSTLWRDRPLQSPISACKRYFGTPCFHLSQWATTSLMKGADAAHRLLMAGTKPPDPPPGAQPHSEGQADSPGEGRSKLDAGPSTATRLRSTSPELAPRVRAM